MLRWKYMATRKIRLAIKRSYRRAVRSETRKRRRAAAFRGDQKKRRPRGVRFFRIEIYPKTEFDSLKEHHLRERGRGERLNGKRVIGHWPATVRRVAKSNAHMDVNNHLIIDNPESQGVLKQIRGPIVHHYNDVFVAQARRTVTKRKRSA